MLGTSPWRGDPAANNAVDAAGHRRECFLQAAFLIHAYKHMKPRSRIDPAPKPASTAACFRPFAVCTRSAASPFRARQRSTESPPALAAVTCKCKQLAWLGCL